VFEKLPERLEIRLSKELRRRRLASKEPLIY
jgi:hypothetical protein